MLRRIIVAIPEDVADRLAELARREFREPKAQASLLLVEAVRRAERRPAVAAASDKAEARS